MLRSVSLSLPRSAVVLLVVLLSRSLVRGGLLSPDKEGSNKDVGSLPGIQAAITGKGLKYLTDIWVPIVKDELSRIELTNCSGEASLGPVKIHYTVGNIDISRLDFGDSSIRSEPKAGLILFLNKSNISAAADWQYKIESDYKLFSIFLDKFSNFLGKFSDHGSLTASADGVQLRVGLNVSADEHGHPRIAMTSCFFEVDALNVTLTGDASPLYNGIIKKFESNLKELFNKTVCKELGIVLRDLDKKLANNPVVVPLGDGTSGLDLTLTGQPDFSSTSIVTNHRGTFVSTSQPNLALHTPPAPLPPLPHSHGKMAYLQVMEYVAQTAIQVYMRAGKLRFNFTADSVKGSGPFLRLDTTTFSLIIPQLFHRFGAQDLMLTVRATEPPPAITFAENGADIAVRAAMDVYVVCNNSAAAESRSRDQIDPVCEHDMPLALTLGVNATVNANFWIGNNNAGNLSIMGTASNLKVKLDIISTNVGDFDVEKINKFAVGLKLIDKIALPTINDWAEEGYTIPDLGVPGLTLKKTELLFQKGYVTLGTDISYQDV